jgi:hypothetical protein
MQPATICERCMGSGRDNLRSDRQAMSPTTTHGDERAHNGDDLVARPGRLRNRTAMNLPESSAPTWIGPES